MRVGKRCQINVLKDIIQNKKVKIETGKEEEEEEEEEEEDDEDER